MFQDNQLDFCKQKFFIGIDTHAKQWTVNIRSNQLSLKTFSMNPSPKELHRHLKRNYPGGSYHSVYEAGFCGFWIHEELKQLGIHNIVVHAADVPTSNKEKNTKTDSVDSRKLAHNLQCIYIPDKLHQDLRALCRLRRKTAQNMTRVKNRIKCHLHFNGIIIPSHSVMCHWSANFIRWLKGLEFSNPPGKDYLSLCIEELENQRQRLAQVTRLLRKHAHRYGIINTLTLFRSIPGIGFVTAITFYSELIDINRFRTFDQLASYVGLTPSISSSDEKSYNRGLTKRRNKILRHMIVESAWTAVRNDPILLLAYNDLTKRMKKQYAIIRIAKKLLNRIRYVWKNQKPYVIGVIE